MGAEASSMNKGNPSNPAALAFEMQKDIFSGKQVNPSNPGVLSLGMQDIGGMVGPQRTESSLMGMAKQAIEAKKMADMGPQKMTGVIDGGQKMNFNDIVKMTKQKAAGMGFDSVQGGVKYVESKTITPCPPGYKPHAGLCYNESVDTNLLVKVGKPVIKLGKPLGFVCPTGYQLKAGMCYAESKPFSCPEGYQLNGGMCNAVSSKIVMADIKKPETIVESRKLKECPPGYRTEPLTCVRDAKCTTDVCPGKWPGINICKPPKTSCSGVDVIPR